LQITLSTVVMVADVLHHEARPLELLRECVRVSKRDLVIKDHQLSRATGQNARQPNRLGGQRALRSEVPFQL
jgi:hypothetical protein